MSNTFQPYLTKLSEAIENEPFGKHPKELYEPIRYILKLGGKRLRPMLALLAYQLGKDDWESIIKPALAVEVFHNFTLMHDDIMDQAPIRRGQPTVHKHWDENIAILSGDAMLVKAYDLLLEVDPSMLPSVIRMFNKCALAVCEGQQIDMNFEQRSDVTVDEYLEMIRLKTAVLLGMSLRLGGTLAGLSQTDTELLCTFGEKIGVGFQLKDDLLDVFSDQEKFGKQVGGDIISNKKTFLLINALKSAEGETGKTLTDWIAKKEFDKEEKVMAVSEIYEQLAIKQLTEEAIQTYFDEGYTALAAIDISDKRKAPLKEFADYLYHREK
ncbi:MAG: polyprenyl synthetase family protein [Cyclobacteriaceae bacterium]